MKKILFFAPIMFVVCIGVSECWRTPRCGDIIGRDGTYVRSHYRSSPNRSCNDNWSVSPNVKSYAGRKGTRKPTWNKQSPD